MPLSKRQAELLRMQARVDQLLAEVNSIAANPSLTPRERRFLARQVRLQQDAMRRIARLIGNTADS
jgi:hypothetical protein